MKLSEENWTMPSPWNGWSFEIETAKHTLPLGLRLPSYEVFTEGGAHFLQF